MSTSSAQPAAVEIAPNTSRKPTVPEAILKKRKTLEKLQAERAARALTQKQEKKEKKKVVFKRAEQFVKEFRTRERDEIRMRKIAKAPETMELNVGDEKLAFVVRVKGINHLAPKPRKILQLLRLTKINSGVFLKLNKSTLHMLQCVNPYVAWGYPSMKSVRDLIFKRGFAKLDHKRVAISDNAVVEAELGKCGVICVEDVVHQIYTVGEHFKEVNRFLAPFMMSNPHGRLEGKKAEMLVEGGRGSGNRGHMINELVEKMN
ncbi:ribosomal protein L30, ferredoxin-like fold domain-containing protein [Chytridium lagenaria]|nr:ribosomal protein L30, ferredoxin-like fold domain-containing protein [Chytridium lagenaria]